MAALTIIEYLTVLKGVSLGSLPGVKVLIVHPVVLQSAEEALGRRIVAAVAGTAHTDADAPAL